MTTNKIEVSGSVTVSKLALALFPSGVTSGVITLNLNGTSVAATEKRATNNVLSLESLCFALVKSGVVGKANLAKILALAGDVATMDEETSKVVASAIAATKKAIDAKLPMVPVAASLRLKGTAVLA